MKKTKSIEYSFTCNDKNVICNESPKINIDNTIIVFHKEDEEPIFNSENGVKAIVQDLNNIFKNKYKINYNAFGYIKTVIKLKKTRKVKDESNELNIFDLDWDYFKKDEIYFTDLIVYKITTNKKFDWKDADRNEPIKYASLIYDVINMKHKIFTEYGDLITNKGWYKVRDGYGGGKTYNNTKVIVSDKNKNYGERGTKGTSKVYLINGKRIGFNKGGVALHEWLYHAMGVTDKGVNHLRKYYNMRIGSEHPNIIISFKISDEEQKQLDKEKKETGDGK